MASTYSSLKIELIGTGDQAGTWGATTNTNLGTAIEEAITGSADVTFVSGGNTAITLTNSNESQAARNLRLNITGSMTTASQYLYVPAIEKFYLINNTLSNTVIVSNGSNAAATGTSVSVPAGQSVLVYNNGTNITSPITHIPSLSNATITSGNITVTNANITTANITTANITTANFTNLTTSNSVVISVNTSGNALRITQTGTGNALLVEDSTNPDSSPFVIDASGNVGIGTTSLGGKLDVRGVSGTTPIYVATNNNTNNSEQPLITAITDNGTYPARIDLVRGSASSYTGLAFVTSNNAAPAEVMRIDPAGNLGLGVTPSAWGSAYKAIDISGFSGFASAGTSTEFLRNAYNDGTNFIYKANGAASRYNQASGAHAWYTALSGTAGNAITFTQAMTLDTSGRLLVGLTSTNTAFGGKLQVEGTGDAFASLVRYSSSAGGAPALYLARSKSATLGTNTIVASADTLGTLVFSGANGTGYSDAAYIQGFVDGTPGASADMPGRLVFSTSADGSATPTERMRIDSSGNVGIGTTSTTSATLTVAGSANITGNITSSGNITTTVRILSSGNTSGVGYSTGAGGTVTQPTSKSNTVTINAMCGTITMNNAALNPANSVTFTLNSSGIAATDVVALNHSSGGTVGAYTLNAQAAAGLANITVRNITAGALSEAIVIRFAVIKAVTA